VEAGNLGAASTHLEAFSGIPVLASDATEVGTLMHVLTSGPVHVFDGIVFDARVGGGGARFADASLVGGFYERGVTLTLGPEACGDLPRPRPPQAPAEDDPRGLDLKLRRAWELLTGG
jgi:hypothetical protein